MYTLQFILADDLQIFFTFYEGHVTFVTLLHVNVTIILILYVII